ncbi:MAG: hypothetical protein AAF637_11695, partial [Pseudomonadota bacterium]
MRVLRRLSFAILTGRGSQALQILDPHWRIHLNGLGHFPLEWRLDLYGERWPCVLVDRASRQQLRRLGYDGRSVLIAGVGIVTRNGRHADIKGLFRWDSLCRWERLCRKERLFRRLLATRPLPEILRGMRLDRTGERGPRQLNPTSGLAARF